MGNPNGAQKSVPKKPEETRELALGGAEKKQDAQRQSGGGRRSKVGGKQCANSQKLEKDWEGVDTRPAAGAKTTIKLRPAQNFRAGAGSARERPASEPGGGSGLGEGSRKLSGYWGVAPAPKIAVLTSSRKPECGSLSVSTNSPQLSGSLQPLGAARDPAFVPAQAGSSPPPISSQAKQPGDWAHAFPSLSSRLLPIRCCGGPALRPDPGLMGLVVLDVGGAEGGA